MNLDTSCIPAFRANIIKRKTSMGLYKGSNDTQVTLALQIRLLASDVLVWGLQNAAETAQSLRVPLLPAPTAGIAVLVTAVRRVSPLRTPAPVLLPCPITSDSVRRHDQIRICL